MVLACDGIFDKCTSTEVIQMVWEGVHEHKGSNVHEQCGIAVDQILKTSVAKKTMDNITVVFVAFEAFHLRGFTNLLPKQVGKASSTGSSADLEIPNEIDQEIKIEKRPNIHPIFSQTHGRELPYVIDEEDMKNIQFPRKCESDYQYVEGQCPTPPYLKPRPKSYKFEFDCPVIITKNPDELHQVPQTFPEQYYQQLREVDQIGYQGLPNPEQICSERQSMAELPHVPHMDESEMIIKEREVAHKQEEEDQAAIIVKKKKKEIVEENE